MTYIIRHISISIFIYQSSIISYDDRVRTSPHMHFTVLTSHPSDPFLYPGSPSPSMSFSALPPSLPLTYPPTILPSLPFSFLPFYQWAHY